MWGGCCVCTRADDCGGDWRRRCPSRRRDGTPSSQLPVDAIARGRLLADTTGTPFRTFERLPFRLRGARRNDVTRPSLLRATKGVARLRLRLDRVPPRGGRRRLPGRHPLVAGPHRAARELDAAALDHVLTYISTHPPRPRRATFFFFASPAKCKMTDPPTRQQPVKTKQKHACAPSSADVLRGL